MRLLVLAIVSFPATKFGFDNSSFWPSGWKTMAPYPALTVTIKEDHQSPKQIHCFKAFGSDSMFSLTMNVLLIVR